MHTSCSYVYSNSSTLQIFTNLLLAYEMVNEFLLLLAYEMVSEFLLLLAYESVTEFLLLMA